MAAGWTVGTLGEAATVELLESELVDAEGARARIEAAGLSGAEPPAVAEVAGTAALLSAEARPLFVAGTPCLLDHAGPDLADLVERTAIPLILKDSARGVVPDDHPGVVPGTGPSVRVAAESGLTVEVTGAAHARALAAAVEPPEIAEWWNLIGEIVGEHASRWARASRSQALPPPRERVGAELAQRMGARGCLVTDRSMSGLADQVIARAPGAVVVLDDPASTVPFAAGRRLARPDEPAVVLTDPAGLERCGMELLAAARAGAPVAVLVIEEPGRGDGPLELLAEMAGGVGDVAETPRALSIALTNALAAKVPSVVRARVAPAVRG